jgi:hypothetical protein
MANESSYGFFVVIPIVCLVVLIIWISRACQQPQRESTPVPAETELHVFKIPGSSPKSKAAAAPATPGETRQRSSPPRPPSVEEA